LEISSLKLKNYRNFADYEINFNSVGALISGKNGVGKTNLLEAIAYFAFGKSFNTNQDEELINFSKAFFHISAKFNLKNRVYQFDVGCDKNRKNIKIDGKNISKISELYQFLKIIYFSPNDIRIIDGSPSLRRIFINQATAQYSFNYLDSLRRYKHILKQRNSILKTNFDTSEKKIWDQQFFKSAIEIIKIRIDYLQKFSPILAEKYFQISGEREKLKTKYLFSFPQKLESIEENFSEQMKKNEHQEKIQQRSLIGPHLDDIDFEIDDKSARKYASQGQKRSLAIAVRFVQADLILKKGNEPPILMFDDVLADLDRDRVGEIIQMLEKNHQIFIATPNATIYQNYELPIVKLEGFSE
jgi:DNA replication and repair protein RecF